MDSDESLVKGLVDGSAAPSRIDVINNLLSQCPIEQHLDWYEVNYPDVYAGYLYAKKSVKPAVKSGWRNSVKLLVVLLVILGVFGLIVFFVIGGFLSQSGLI